MIEERVATVNGIARATLRSNGRSGTATVSASSGAGVTTEAVTVEIGSSGERTVNVTANPATLGPFDFTSEITATVTDNNGNPIPGASVIFSTDAGSLASAGSVLLTNVNGQAFDRLTLLDDRGLSATVTVTSGSTSGSVSVTRGRVQRPADRLGLSLSRRKGRDPQRDAHGAELRAWRHGVLRNPVSPLPR